MVRQRRWLTWVLDASREVDPMLFPWHRTRRHRQRLRRRGLAHPTRESA